MGSKSLIGDQLENRKCKKHNPSLSLAAMAILNMTAMMYISCEDVAISDLSMSCHTTLNAFSLCCYYPTCAWMETMLLQWSVSLCSAFLLDYECR
jgi:hypothetical protein